MKKILKRGSEDTVSGVPFRCSEPFRQNSQSGLYIRLAKGHLGVIRPHFRAAGWYRGVQHLLLLGQSLGVDEHL